nr:PIG-L family deacetylase [Angustibacter aerolatus]
MPLPGERWAHRHAGRVGGRQDRVTRRLLLVHAHPDDETLTTGATMAAAAADGVEVTLVTCTLGGRGEVLADGDESLAALEGDDAALSAHRADEPRRGDAGAGRARPPAAGRRPVPRLGHDVGRAGHRRPGARRPRGRLRAGRRRHRGRRAWRRCCASGVRTSS